MCAHGFGRPMLACVGPITASVYVTMCACLHERTLHISLHISMYYVRITCLCTHTCMRTFECMYYTLTRHANNIMYMYYVLRICVCLYTLYNQNWKNNYSLFSRS